MDEVDLARALHYIGQPAHPTLGRGHNQEERKTCLQEESTTVAP